MNIGARNERLWEVLRSRGREAPSPIAWVTDELPDDADIDACRNPCAQFQLCVMGSLGFAWDGSVLLVVVLGA